MTDNEAPKRGRKPSPLTAAVRKVNQTKKRVIKLETTLEELGRTHQEVQGQLEEAKLELTEARAELSGLL